MTAVYHRGQDTASRYEVRTLGVDDEKVCFLPDLERGQELLLLNRPSPALRGVSEHVFRLRLKAGDLVSVAIPPDSFGHQGDSHHLEHVVRVVVGAEGDGAARRSQSGDGRADPSVRRHRGLVRNRGAGSAEQGDLGLVDIPGVCREQPGTKEVVLIKVFRWTDAVVPHHELELGAALIQMDGIADIVFLGEGADGL